jgi:hypothetical protein
MFGHVPACVYVSYRPNVCFQAAATHARVALLAEKMSDKNLEQWINIKFYVKVRKSDSKALHLAHQ